jgi:hypothetical protein
VRGVVVVGGQRDPREQQLAPRRWQPTGQLGGRAWVAQRQAQYCLQLIGAAQQGRGGPGQDGTRRVDGRQRLPDLPAERPDRRPVEQRQELERGSPLLRNGQCLLGEPFSGVEVPLLQRDPGQGS